MDRLYLREMAYEDKEEVISYINEFVEAGSEINGLSGATSCKSFDELFFRQQQKKNIKFSGYEQDKSPQITYLVIRKSDERIVGTLNIRFNLVRVLDENFSGNIGYGIRPTERKKGYATEAMKLALDILRERGNKIARAGCYSSNTASKKVIMKNGGKLINHKERLTSEDYYEIEL